MIQDDKKTSVILYIIGIIPVIWLSLLIAPYLNNGGLVELVKHSNEIFNNPFNIVICGNSVKTILIFVIVYILSILTYESTRKNYRKKEEHGSAKWGNAKSLNKKYKQPKNYNKILTKNVCLGLNGRKHRRNVNVLVVGRKSELVKHLVIVSQM